MARVLIVKSRRRDVLLDGTPLHRRERGRRVIRLRSSRGHVECVPVRERDGGRAESFMDGDASLVSLGEGFRKTNPIAFDDQVQVKARDAKEEISDEPAYGIHADVASFSEFTGFLQERKKWCGQPVLHEVTNGIHHWSRPRFFLLPPLVQCKRMIDAWYVMMPFA